MGLNYGHNPNNPLQYNGAWGYGEWRSFILPLIYSFAPSKRAGQRERRKDGKHDGSIHADGAKSRLGNGGGCGPCRIISAFWKSRQGQSAKSGNAKNGSARVRSAEVGHDCAVESAADVSRPGGTGTRRTANPFLCGPALSRQADESFCMDGDSGAQAGPTRSRRGFDSWRRRNRFRWRRKNVDAAGLRRYLNGHDRQLSGPQFGAAPRRRAARQRRMFRAD